MYKHVFKRVFGFLVALVAVILLSPLFVVVIVWLHFANKGAGVFFYQKRPGLHGKIFKVIKFKSMTDERDEDGYLLPDSQRLTKAGRFVRATSIDELPQLLNIVKGDMALIGPRPLSVSYLAYYNDEEQHRHDVRPGITGWAQVNGRTSIDWPQRMAFDLEYVRNLSFWLDVKIFCLTIYNVLNRKDVGVDQSGARSFYDYREEQWEAQGRKDLIDAAREKSGRNRK